MRRFRIVLGCALVAAAAMADDLAVARHALADKLYEVAERRASAWLGRYRGERTGGVEALQILSQALAEAGRYDELLTRLDRHAEIVDAAPDPGVFAFWRALAQLETGAVEAALRSVAAVTDAQTTPAQSAALRRIAARARLAMNDLDGALKLFAEVEAAGVPADIRLANLLEWGVALEAAGRFTEALAVIERHDFTTLNQGVAEQGALLRGRLLRRLARHGEAETWLRRLAEDAALSEAARVHAWMEVAALAQDGSRNPEALTAARAALELARAPALRRTAAFRLSDLLLSAPEGVDEGETRMKAFIREYAETPEAPEAQLRLARALQRFGRFERAAAEYGVFLETFGATARELEALTGRAQALAALGRYSEAFNLYQRAHDRATNRAERAEHLFRAADMQLADNRPHQAAQTYRTVYSDYADSPLADRARFQTADSLERAGDAVQAEELFRQVGERAADEAHRVRAQLRLAALQSARDAVDEAVARYTAVLNMTTAAVWRAEALLGRGRANYRAYRFESALTDSLAAAEAHLALRDEARFLEVMNLYGLRRDDEARQTAVAFMAAFPESPRLPDMLLWLAKFEFNHERFDAARDRCLEYVALWPTGPWADAALLWAGRATFRLADYTRTVELMARLYKELPQSPRLAEGRFLQADALVELARFDEAVLLLDEVVTRFPESDWVTSAWGRKGDCLFSMGTETAGRFAEAMQAYREMLARRDVTPEMRLQGEFKIGRCLEKLKRTDEAIEQYYTRVILRFIEDRSLGAWHAEAAATWFTRATFQMADLLTQKGDSEAAAQALLRVVQAGVPGQVEALQRLERLRVGR